jgi:hypothetical protein
MLKIDRLGWAAGVCGVAYGLRIGIRVNKREVLASLEPCLPPAWKPASSPIVDRLYSLVVGAGPARPNVRFFHLLYGGAARLARTLILEDVFEALESDLQLYVAEHACRRLFVHAGVVEWKGRAIIIPGRSFSGKSTLVAALLQAGATYYSDEYAVFDAQGRVHPYPRPLSLRGPAGSRPQRQWASALGVRTGRGPLPVAVIAFTKYQPEGRWRPRRLTAGKAVLELLGHTVSVRRQPEIALTRLQQVVAQAQTLKGERGEANDMSAALLKTVEQEWATRPAVKTVTAS